MDACGRQLRPHRAPFEAHYFHTAGNVEMTVPAGTVTVEVMKGFDVRLERQTVQVAAAEKSTPKHSICSRLGLPQDADSQWVSGDVHVHMNYGGTYRNTPAHLVEQAAAENLQLVEDLVVNKEQRIPDIAYFSHHARSGLDGDAICFCTGRNFIPATGDISACCT